MLLSFIITTIKHNTTHKLLNGISSGGCIADAVLEHGSFCLLPVDGQRAGGRIIHTQVPGAATGHCNQKNRGSLKIICLSQPFVCCLCPYDWLLIYFTSTLNFSGYSRNLSVYNAKVFCLKWNITFNFKCFYKNICTFFVITFLSLSLWVLMVSSLPLNLPQRA